MTGTDRTPHGEVAAAISRDTVKLLREYTGRGPTKVPHLPHRRSRHGGLAGHADDGRAQPRARRRADLVLKTRKAFQRTMAPQLIASVERHTGRKVLAFLSDNHVDPDVAVESFVLEPRADGARGRGRT